MRLETLHLRNFGSFEDATIDLSSVHAGVISGQNGAGKSTAFVDGPLWALFGKCRTGTDQMLRLGADEMAVTITFQLNGQTYRVIRKRSVKSKAGKSDLALQLSVGEGWEDVSGARLPETQDKITALLNADFELLTATAFLLQGQADKFSRATPSERKAILAQILRLDQYSLLKQAASRHATIAEVKQSEKGMALTVRQNEAATLPSLVTRHEELATALTESEAAIANLEQHQQELTAKQGRLEAELAQLASIPDQVKALQGKRTALLASVTGLINRKTRAERILGKKDDIDAKIAELTQLKDQVTLCQTSIDQMTAQVATVQQDLDYASSRILDGNTIHKAYEQAVRHLEAQLQAYQQESDRLAEELGRDIQQGKLLTVVPCDSGLQARCRFTITAVETMAKVPTKQVALEARQLTDESFPEYRAAVKTAADAYKVWMDEDWRKKHSELTGKRTELQTLLNNSRPALEQLRRQIAECEKYTVLKPELDAAEREVAQVDQDLARIAADQATIDQELEQLQAKGNARANLQAEHINVVASLGQDKIYLAQIRRDDDVALGRLKEIEVEMKQAKEASRQVEVLQQECAQLALDGTRFTILSNAYTQIPVLIMETAIPLLEEEANRILGKISTSGMRVRFDTQKSLKSRDGLAETLEIVVRDVFGERPLESFSGGERARADLAIRIGLSKLLANRAGARLETLIVDEAFAAVDREGVEQLVECLPMLSEEFSVLLFITHDENFKSSVAQQLIVKKGNHGSHVEVIV